MKFLIDKKQIEKVIGALSKGPWENSQPVIEMLIRLPMLKKQSVGNEGAEEQSEVTTLSDQGE